MPNNDFMQIQPEALYSLYDTIIIPAEKQVLEPKKLANMDNPSSLTLFFNKECSKFEIDFLSKIFKAINVSDDKVQIINLTSTCNISEFISRNTGTLLLWGMDYDSLEKYTPIKRNDTVILRVDLIETVMNNPELKGKLWNCLKPLFII